MTDLSAYRPNVGIVLFHPGGQVWLGRRKCTPGPFSWQFPQGGVDEGEDLLQAAQRELAEETGVTSTTFLARTEGWLSYDFPPDHGSKSARGWKGQRQVWFAFRFDGEAAEVNLEAHGDPEFNAWRWGFLNEAPDLVVPFKRNTYLAVVQAFQDLPLGQTA